MKSSVVATGARQQSSCPWCGEKFKSKNKLKKHIGEDHKQEHAASRSRQATAQTTASDDLQQTVQTTASDDLQPSDQLPSNHDQSISRLPAKPAPSRDCFVAQPQPYPYGPNQPYGPALQSTPYLQVPYPDHYTQSKPYSLYDQYWPQPYGWWQEVQPAAQSIQPAEQQLPTQQQPTSTWDSDSDDDWPQEAEEEKKTAQNDDYTSGREDHNYGEEENYSEGDDEDEYICDDCWEDL